VRCSKVVRGRSPQLLAFQDAGEHELRGVPDRWRLYRMPG